MQHTVRTEQVPDASVLTGAANKDCYETHDAR